MEKEPALPVDTWAAGVAYEPYVGRWSRLVAREFVAWLGLPPGGRWLDVGCGTGALTSAILDNAAPREVVGVDPSPGFLAHARQRITDPRVRFATGDAQSLPVSPDTCDAVVSGLVLNFVPDPERAVTAMTGAARDGGVVAAYVWDYSEGMQFMRYFWDAVTRLDPAARELDEGRRFAAICRPDALGALWSSAGLHAIDTRAIVVATDFRDFTDFWTPFLGGQGPAPSYVAALDDGQREALREEIRARIPTAPDGSIQLTARAWAVRGTK